LQLRGLAARQLKYESGWRSQKEEKGEILLSGLTHFSAELALRLISCENVPDFDEGRAA